MHSLHLIEASDHYREKDQHIVRSHFSVSSSLFSCSFFARITDKIYDRGLFLLFLFRPTNAFLSCNISVSFWTPKCCSEFRAQKNQAQIGIRRGATHEKTDGLEASARRFYRSFHDAAQRAACTGI